MPALNFDAGKAGRVAARHDACFGYISENPFPAGSAAFETWRTGYADEAWRIRLYGVDEVEAADDV